MLFRSSTILGLVIIIGLLFAITGNSKNENILNYKKLITNQYATWDQELTEREAIIREKEKLLMVEE